MQCQTETVLSGRKRSWFLPWSRGCLFLFCPQGLFPVGSLLTSFREFITESPSGLGSGGRRQRTPLTALPECLQLGRTIKLSKLAYDKSFGWPGLCHQHISTPTGRTFIQDQASPAKVQRDLHDGDKEASSTSDLSEFSDFSRDFSFGILSCWTQEFLCFYIFALVCGRLDLQIGEMAGGLGLRVDLSTTGCQGQSYQPDFLIPGLSLCQQP